MIFLAALVPVLCSLVFGVIGPRPQNVRAGTKRPGLAFDEYVVDLREVEPAARVPARFGFTNRSSETVTVKELKPSCGCLNPHIVKKSFAPGESGEFYLQVWTANETPGPHEYTCRVLYEDSQPREALLTFRLILPKDQVTVRPRALAVYQLSPKTTTYTITVTDFRAQRLNILGVTSSLEFVHAEPAELVMDRETGAIQYPITVAIEGVVPSGASNGTLEILTDDDVHSRIVVPLRVIGPKAKPETLAKPDDARSGTRTR